MTAYARKSGEVEATWSVTALLHDFDWEIHPTLPDHPTKGEPILAARGVDEEIRFSPMPISPECRGSRCCRI